MSLLPTPRYLGLLLLPAALLIAATWVPGLRWIALLLVIVALAAGALDRLAAPRARQIEVERRHDPLLSIGRPNRVHVLVRNRSGQVLDLRLRDEAPNQFRTEPLVLEGAVPAHGEAELSYVVTPFRRGEYGFGGVVMRYPGPLGLVEAQVRKPLEEKAVVYPDVLELRRHTLTVRGNEEERQAWTRRRGGTEFERLREYTPDDEFRFIDWNATARVGRPIARQYQTERNQNVLLAFDLGRQMTSQYGELLKVDHAINSGVVLAWVAAQRKENVGLITFKDRVQAYLPPRSGRLQFKRMLDVLYSVQPELIEPDYRAAFQHVALNNPRRSLVVVFTDVADRATARSLLSAISVLQPKHLPLVVLLMDPALRRYSEAEPESEDDIYRVAVAQRLVGEREGLKRTLEVRGMDVLDVPAERLSVSLLDQYLRIKARARL